MGIFCLAGADLPADDRRLQRWLRERAWTNETLLRNDTFAVLRAGTERTWGVGVVCGLPGVGMTWLLKTVLKMLSIEMLGL